MKTFKQYFNEYVVAQSKTREWHRHMDMAHGQGGTIWIWSPRGGLLWSRSAGSEIYLNRKKIKLPPKGPSAIWTHGVLVDVIFDIDRTIGKQFTPYSDMVSGRISREGYIVIYDEDQKKDRDMDKAVDAIYKYIKEK